MILPLLVTTPLPMDRVCVDHAPLVSSMNVRATMLAPDREAWAVASVEEVGPLRKRGLRFEERDTTAETFDLRLRVKDGWKVPLGPTSAFWWEGDKGSRRDTVARMVGQTVLVRFAPVIDGRHTLVSGTDAEPVLQPTFDARAGERFVSILLPYGAERLEGGDPKWRRWATLWRAGAALSPSAYFDFDQYVGAARFPLTPPWTGKARLDAGGKLLDNDVLGLADAEWLLKLARGTGPEFQLLVAEHLGARGVAGMIGLKRELVLRSLRDPGAFPNGLFRVADFQNLFIVTQFDNASWLPQGATISAILAARSVPLATDLLELLQYPRVHVAERARLLPLLASPVPQIRASALRAFAVWHGTPPTGSDPVAWHTARARLGVEALKAAKSAPGG